MPRPEEVVRARRPSSRSSGARSSAERAPSGISMTGRASTRAGLLAQPGGLVLRHVPGVEAQLRAAHALEREPGERRTARSRYGVYDVEMMKAGMRALTASSVLSACGHEQHLLGAELLHVLVGDVERLEERREQAQRVAGVVARPADDVGEEVVVAAEPGEELGAVRDEPLRDLLGVVVAGERALAVGDVDAAGRRALRGRRRPAQRAGAHRSATSASTSSVRSSGSRVDSANTQPFDGVQPALGELPEVW